MHLTPTLLLLIQRGHTIKKKGVVCKTECRVLGAVDHPLEGYRRLTFMMLDADMVACVKHTTHVRYAELSLGQG
jgi:hypothetical protein